MSLRGQDKEENLIEELNIDVSQPPCYLDSLFFIHLSIIKCNTMNGMPKDQRKEQESHLQVTFTYLPTYYYISKTIHETVIQEFHFSYLKSSQF